MKPDTEYDDRLMARLAQTMSLDLDYSASLDMQGANEETPPMSGKMPTSPQRETETEMPISAQDVSEVKQVSTSEAITSHESRVSTCAVNGDVMETDDSHLGNYNLLL